MTLTMFREAPGADGKPGPVSYRRVASAVLILAALALFGAGLAVLTHLPEGVPGWAPVLPGALCLAGALLMPILTSVTDVVALVQAGRKAAKATE